MSFKYLAFLLILWCSLSCPSLRVVGAVLPHQFGPGRLSGTITSDGYPVSGADITVKSILTGKTIKTATNKKGNFALVGLDFGGYEVTVNVRGYRSEAKTVLVTHGIGGTSVNFDIVPEGESVLGVIKGTVKDKKSSQNLQDAQIDIVDARTGRLYKVQTDSSGSYKKDGLVPGPYKITVTSKDYRQSKKDVTLKESEVRELHFWLKGK